jgi:sterol desaturase/sphingolipid hydroxylase (fatty acid hydroxylase superfamily)
LDTESKKDGVKSVARTPIRLVEHAVGDTRALIKESGHIPNRGWAATILGLSLATLCVLGVLAFHYPEYLTTPELRANYNVEMMRHILFGSLVLAGSLAVMNLVLNRQRSINGVALVLVIAAVAMGGSHVPVHDFPDHTPYIGLDWFILDLLASTTIFVLIEKMFPLYRGQPIFRDEWQTDFVHFAVNHFIVGLILLAVNFLIHRMFDWLVQDNLQATIHAIPFIPQLLLCVLVADMVQYWTHRGYHEVPFLWPFHSVHHSTKTLDWLAGSRQHILELVVTRVGVLGALYVCGFEKHVMDAYIIIVGFQAVFNHANVHLPWGPLRYIIVTPDFHHWHHSSDDVAIDRNYAAHYAFLDYLFGTAVRGQKGFPSEYGVVGDYMPDGFAHQQAFPFRRQTKK